MRKGYLYGQEHFEIEVVKPFRMRNAKKIEICRPRWMPSSIWRWLWREISIVTI